MKLIPNWQQAWKMFSVQVAALAILWTALPADTHAAILGTLGISQSQVPGIIGIVTIIARLVAQPSVAAPTTQE